VSRSDQPIPPDPILYADPRLKTSGAEYNQLQYPSDYSGFLAPARLRDDGETLRLEPGRMRWRFIFVFIVGVLWFAGALSTGASRHGLHGLLKGAPCMAVLAIAFLLLYVGHVRGDDGGLYLGSSLIATESSSSSRASGRAFRAPRSSGCSWCRSRLSAFPGAPSDTRGNHLRVSCRSCSERTNANILGASSHSQTDPRSSNLPAAFTRRPRFRCHASTASLAANGMSSRSTEARDQDRAI
jgi:hypothetical protein